MHVQDKFLHEKQGGGNALKGQSSGGDIRKYFSLSKVPTQVDKPSDSSQKASDEEGSGVDRSQAGRLAMSSQQQSGIGGRDPRAGIAGISQQDRMAGRSQPTGIAHQTTLKQPRGKPTGKGKRPDPASAMKLLLRRDPSHHQDQAPTAVTSLPSGSQPTRLPLPAQAHPQRSAPSTGVIDLTSDNEEEAPSQMTCPPMGVGCPAGSPVEDVWHYSPPDNSEPTTTKKSEDREQNVQNSQDSPTLRHVETLSRGGEDLGTMEAPGHPLQGPFPGRPRSAINVALSPTKRTLLENDNEAEAGPSNVLAPSLDETPAKKKLPPMMHRQRQAIDEELNHADAVDLTSDDSPIVTKVVPPRRAGLLGK